MGYSSLTKYRKAKEKDIVLIMTLNHLSGMHLSDEDIIILVANLLEHAIVFCEKCSDVSNKIKFKMVQENEKLVVAVNIPIRILTGQILRKEIKKEM